MRLLTCHIENFGKLSDVNFDFGDNPFVLNQKNGWGKSTLAAFIRVMFFGFANEGKRSAVENERKRYSPWQKGRYGGELTFERGGTEYELSRTFGAKEKEDSFSLRRLDTNLECNDFSAAIGEEMFQIDGESFARTVFIAQNSCITSPTDSIHAKIGNLAENTDDINNYEKVQKRLTDLLNNMSPTRKTGKIKRLEDQISALRVKIKKGTPIDDAVSDCMDKLHQERTKRETLKAGQETIQKQIKDISVTMDRQDEKKEYQRICRQFEEQKQKLEQEKQYFIDEIPTMASVREQREQVNRLPAYQAQMQSFELTETEQKTLESLQQQFRAGIPEDSEIDRYSAKAENYSSLLAGQADLKLSRSEEVRLEELDQKFAQGVPVIAELQNYIREWNLRTEKKSGIGAKKATLHTLETVYQSAGQAKRETQPVRELPWVLIAGVLLAVIGVAVFFHSMIGLAWIGLGALLIVVSLMTKKDIPLPDQDTASQPDQERETLAGLAKEIADEEAYIQTIETDIHSFFLRYQMPWQEANVIDTLYGLQNESQEYQKLILKQKQYREKVAEASLDEILRDIRSFLSTYFPGQIISASHFLNTLQSLKVQRSEYLRLAKKRQNYDKAKNNYDVTYAAVTDFVYRLKFVVQSDLAVQLDEIRDHLNNIATSIKAVGTAETIKLQFEHDHDTKSYQEITDEAGPQALETLSDQLKVCSGQLDDIVEIIQGYETQIDNLLQERLEITEAEEELERIQEEKQELEHRYQILNHTKAYLEQAKENFTAKYMGPVMQGFKKYYKLLSGQEADDYRLDANINITAREHGQQRDTALLSAGYQDLIGLCMRMALVDVMFQGEKPFIVLDDSFVNLDDERVKGGLAFMQEIAKEYQVIYFTCHNSRS